ncbi:MAG TPA: VTT domain-containing protein [Rhizomicrobium sp.]|nr:VTT domain-containing protein [Rhizomicrobium sp.]
MIVMSAGLFSIAFPISRNPAVIIGAIVFATFIHEDLATIATGIAVAEGVTTAEIALPALYAGIVLGDFGLYGLGRLIALNRFSTRALNRGSMLAFKGWLDRRMMMGVFIVRFLPGLRLSAYTSYGFFAMPFWRFALAVLAAASIWTVGLFYLSYTFGAMTAAWLGLWRWPAMALTFLVPLLLLRKFATSKSVNIAGGDRQA